MNKYFIFIILAFLSFSFACFNNTGSKKTSSKVEIKKVNDQYRLFVNNKPFYVKGAGIDINYIENLASHGANSFRTWRTNDGGKSALSVLDEAEKTVQWF